MKQKIGIKFSEIEFSTNGRVMPEAIQVEKDVLGAIMVEPSCFDVAKQILSSSEAFYKLEHQKIFEAFENISARFQLPDLTATVHELKKMGDLDFCGGVYGIAQLTNAITGTLFLERDCLILREKFIRRSLIAMSATLFKFGFEDTTDTLDIVDYCQKQFDGLVNNISSGTGELASNIASKVILDIEQILHKEVEFTGIQCGFETIDKATCGWQPTDLIILAARPSVGKTAFALNVARNIAKLCNKVGLFSLEMGKKQLVKRLLSTSSQIRLDKINRARLSNEEFQSLLISSGHKEFENITIDDTAGINIFEFRSKARRMVKDGAKIIIVDYLQLMSGSGKEQNREAEISAISRGMKKTAKELNVPIISLSQLSRKIEDRAGKEPQLSDLRESGAIEQDADIVGFLMRDEAQNMETEVNGFLKIKKHRNGPLIDVPLKIKLDLQEWYEDSPMLGWKPITNFNNE